MTQIIGNPKGVSLCITTCDLALACSQDTLVPLGKDQHPRRAQWPMPMRGAPFSPARKRIPSILSAATLEPHASLLSLDFHSSSDRSILAQRSQTVVRQDSPLQRLTDSSRIQKSQGIYLRRHLRRMMIPISFPRAASASDCIAQSAIDYSHLSIGSRAGEMGGLAAQLGAGMIGQSIAAMTVVCLESTFQNGWTICTPARYRFLDR